MVDDSIDEALRAGLRKTEAELERLAADLSPPEPSPENSLTPPNPLDSDDAKDAGFMIAEILGEGLRSLLFAERPAPASPRPRLSRFFFSRSPVVAPPTPPPLVAAAPAPAETPAPQPTPISSESPLKGIDLVGHRERLDIESDVRHQVRESKLKGPIIGGIIPPE